MKKTMGALAALFAIMATLLLGTATAQATTPPSQCQNTGLINVIVVCDIDVDDNGVLNGNDIKVLIPVVGNLSNNDLNDLVSVLDDLDLDLKNIDVNVLSNILQDVIDKLIVGVILKLPYH